MIVEDQGETMAFLSRPETYGGGNEAVRRVETHISEIFLAGKFPYLDLSTPEKRLAADVRFSF